MTTFADGAARRIRRRGRQAGDEIRDAGSRCGGRSPVICDLEDQVRGRDFTEADGFGKPRVVIVSEKTAERFFSGQDPIGRHITLKMMTPEPAEIVGVVREVKLSTLDASAAESETALYAPAAQFPVGGLTLVARTAGEPPH